MLNESGREEAETTYLEVWLRGRPDVLCGTGRTCTTSHKDEGITLIYCHAGPRLCRLRTQRIAAALHSMPRTCFPAIEFGEDATARDFTRAASIYLYMHHPTTPPHITPHHSTDWMATCMHSRSWHARLRCQSSCTYLIGSLSYALLYTASIVACCPP